MAAPSFEQYEDTGIAQALVDRPDLAFAVGDVSEMFMGGGAAMADLLTGWAAGRVRPLYLDGARGQDLDTYADDHYGIQRPQASKAVGQVTLSRATAAAGAGTLAPGFVVATQRDPQGKEVRIVTTAPAVFGATDLSKTVNAQAEAAGVDGNVLVGRVARMVSAPFDPTITVSNAVRFAGGDEAEGDDDFKERVRLFLRTLRRGTKPALEYGALQVPSIRRATATVDQNAIVTVYVTDANGNSNAAMVADATAELENWAAGGVLWQVSGGTLLTANIVAILTVRAGVSAAALVVNVNAALAARVRKLKIGETLYLSSLQAAAFAVSPDITEAEIMINGAATNLEPTGPSAVIRPGTVSSG